MGTECGTSPFRVLDLPVNTVPNRVALRFDHPPPSYLGTQSLRWDLVGYVNPCPSI